MPQPTATPTAIVPTPTAAPTLVPTPSRISAEDSSSFQVIRHNWVDPLPSNVFAGRVSPDGRLLVLGGCDLDEAGYCFDQTVLRLYDVDTGHSIRDLQPISPVIEMLAFSPDSTLLAVGGCDMPLYLVGEPDTNCRQPRLWIDDVATGEVAHDLDAFESNITSLVFSPDGSRLYAGVVYSTGIDKPDNEIRVYDTASGERIGWIETGVHNCTTMRLELSPDGRYLIMDGPARCSWPGMVEWWDVSDPARPRVIYQEDVVNRHFLSPDGSTVLLRNPNNESFMLYEVATGDRLHAYPPIGRDAAVRQYLNGDRLLVATRTGLGVFDLTSGTMLQEIVPSGYAFYGEYALSPDRRTLITFGYADTQSVLRTDLSLWDTDSWQETPITEYLMHGLNGSPNGLSGFYSEQTRYVGAGFEASDITVLGSGSPEMAVAEQVMLDYLDDLARGDYAAAAALLRVEEDALTWPADMPYVYQVGELVPEAAAGDLAGQLAILCATPDYPCMPVRDVAYRSQVSPTAFLFLVTYAGPEGEIAVWPLCGDNPDPINCERSDGLFEYYVERQEDGTYRLVNSFPPGLEMRQIASYQ